jgi:hypothetical protein
MNARQGMTNVVPSLSLHPINEKMPPMKRRKVRPRRSTTTCRNCPKPSSKLLRRIHSRWGERRIKLESYWVRCAPTTLTLINKTDGRLVILGRDHA